MSNRYTIAAIAAAMTLPAGMGLAETYDATGTGYGTASSEVMEAGESMMVVHANTQYERLDMGDETHPMASLTGPCFGAVSMIDGAAEGSGNCLYTDADGDMAVMRWTVTGMSEEGRTMGDWEIAGGTGKWQQATGSGSFDAGGEGADYTNNFTGEIMLQ